jgi:Flp pilus assembly protein TadG
MTKPAARPERLRERGGIAVLVAVSFTTLFALSALAVDAGFLYQGRQKLQTAADAAVMAGLQDLSTSTSTASTDATNILTASGFSSGVTVDTSTARQLKVTVSLTQQLFFGRLFGLSSKSMTVTSTGRVLAAPAIFAGNSSCSVTGPVAPIGLNFSAGTPSPPNGLTINGDLETNGGIFINNPLSGGGTQTYNSGSGCSCSGCSSATGGGGSYTFPFSYTAASFTCGNGTSLTATGTYNVPASPSGVYCNHDDINVSVTSGGPYTATFVSAAGTVTISSTGVNLVAAQNGVVIYAGGAGGGSNVCSPASVALGSGSLTFNGSVLAPAGCISVNTASLTLTGSLAGAYVGVQITNGTITPGSAGSTYQLYQ